MDLIHNPNSNDHMTCTPTPPPAPMVIEESRPEAVISSTAQGIQFGSWIPSLVSDSYITIDIRNAFYVKVERLVVCTFDIAIVGIASVMDSKLNSSVRLEGLPNASISSDGHTGSLVVSYFKTVNSDIRSVSGTIKSNSNTVDLWCQKQGTSGLSRLVLQDISSNNVLTGTVTYITSN